MNLLTLVLLRSPSHKKKPITIMTTTRKSSSTKMPSQRWTLPLIHTGWMDSVDTTPTSETSLTDLKLMVMISSCNPSTKTTLLRERLTANQTVTSLLTKLTPRKHLTKLFRPISSWALPKPRPTLLRISQSPGRDLTSTRKVKLRSTECHNY